MCFGSSPPSVVKARIPLRLGGLIKEINWRLLGSRT